MDDGILLSSNMSYLKYCLKEITKFLDNYLNNKTKIININKEGAEFLGFRFYIDKNVYLKLRNDTKKIIILV